MAAPIKTPVTIFNNITLTAGAVDTVSSWIQVDTSFPSIISAVVLNGPTAPATPVIVQAEFNNDWNGGSPPAAMTTKLAGPVIADTLNNGGGSWPIPVPLGAQAVRVTAGNNTVQDATINSSIGKIDSIA